MLELYVLLFHLRNYAKLNNCKLFQLQHTVLANEARLKRCRNSTNSNFPAFYENKFLRAISVLDEFLQLVNLKKGCKLHIYPSVFCF